MTTRMKATKRFFIAIFAALFFVLTFAAIGLFNKPTKTAKAAETTTNIVFQDGASIRLTEPSGVRFTADLNANLENVVYTVNNGEVSLVSGVELGMIVVPAAALENVGTADVFDYLYTTYGKTKEQVSTQFNAGGDGKIVLNKAGTAYCIKGAIVNITNKNYNRPYQAVAYYKLSESSEYVYSAMSDTRTISYVADAALRNKDYGSQETTLTNIVKQAYTLKNPEATTVNVGKTVDLKTLMPDVEDKANYTFAIKSGEANVSLSGSVVTGLATGEATVTVSMNAYGGKTIELSEIALNVTYPQINVETEVDAGLDLATAIGGTVASVTLDDQPVEHTNGVVTLAVTDAAKEAKPYIVTDSEGAKYQVNAKIWSLFIDNATELMSWNNYTYQEEYVVNASTNQKTYKVWGYFKFTSNVDMTGQTWAKENRLATSVDVTSSAAGFLGVIDGNGKTIDNLTFGSGNDKLALISMTGETAEVKNLSITNVVYSYIHAVGTIANTACGGTFENLVIDVKSGLRGWSLSNASGALFSKVYTYASPVTVKNVKLINNSSNFGTGTYEYGTALGATDLNKTRLILDGVTIIGFNDYLLAVRDWNSSTDVGFMGMNSMRNPDKSASTEEKSIYDYATVQGNGVKAFNSKTEYTNSATVLTAQEVELDAAQDYTVTVDFTKMVKGEIARVTIDGTLIEGTSKKFTKAEASNVAKVCLIEMKDFSLYKVEVTVWSLLIADETELMAANAYGTITDGAYYGYFKMVGDADLTGKTWAKTNMIDYGSTKGAKAKGFQGVFDGNGKTIKGLKITTNETGLFFSIGTNAVIKNLSITNATMTNASAGGVLSYYANGGTVDGVSVQVTAMPTTSHFDLGKGLLFGLINAYGDKITVKNVTLTNSVPNAAYGQTATDMATAFGRLTARADSILNLDNVTINGCGNYILAVEVNKATIVGAKCVITLGADTGVIVDADKDGVVDEAYWSEANGLKDYVVIGSNGVTIDGVKVTE
ncbi:MAG: hypothetical protein IKA88_02815 [Clostridia bacterium]|nr:hypothetical protein [Clostridia bacterium]